MTEYPNQANGRKRREAATKRRQLAEARRQFFTQLARYRALDQARPRPAVQGPSVAELRAAIEKRKTNDD